MFFNLSELQGVSTSTERFGYRDSDKNILFYEKSNVYDPYAMVLARSTQATVTGIDVVCHLPREISRFCKFFYDFGGELSAVVRESKYRRSPILQGG